MELSRVGDTEEEHTRCEEKKALVHWSEYMHILNILCMADLSVCIHDPVAFTQVKDAAHLEVDARV